MFRIPLVWTSLILLASPAWAQANQPSGFEMMLPFIIILAIFYFLIIRPQAKRQREHQKFLSELKRGDSVITSSGILGTIEGLTDQYVTLEIADDVKVKMLRSQVASTQATAEKSSRDKKA